MLKTNGKLFQFDLGLMLTLVVSLQCTEPPSIYPTPYPHIFTHFLGCEDFFPFFCHQGWKYLVAPRGLNIQFGSSRSLISLILLFLHAEESSNKSCWYSHLLVYIERQHFILDFAFVLTLKTPMARNSGLVAHSLGCHFVASKILGPLLSQLPLPFLIFMIVDLIPMFSLFLFSLSLINATEPLFI